MDAAIEIKSYQKLEDECKAKPEMIEDISSEYQYIVADECHYFLMDSMFNTYTQISFNWNMNKRKETVIVFISATGERIKKYVQEKTKSK